MNITVCKDCKRREIGCHSTCQDYIREREAMNEENKRIKEAMWKEAEVVARQKAGMHKMATTKRKGKR